MIYVLADTPENFENMINYEKGLNAIEIFNMAVEVSKSPVEVYKEGKLIARSAKI